MTNHLSDELDRGIARVLDAIVEAKDPRVLLAVARKHLF